MAGQLEAQFGVSQTSGQGDFVFSWEQELTAKFSASSPPPGIVAAARANVLKAEGIYEAIKTRAKQ